MPAVNTILTLKDLPASPPDKSGWPWTEQSETLPEKMPDGSEWPCISIVTPSYNQGQFLEETIRSVLLQGYPNIEYIIIDGGSTDNSVEIIKTYEQYLSFWVSEPDKGQTHALNKGFRKATGQLIGWQNSDDYYHSEAFLNTVKALGFLKKCDIVYGSTKYVDEDGNFVRDYPVSSFNIYNMIPHINMCNQSMFFKRKIFDENNFLDENFHHCMDLEFFLRLAIKGYKFYYYPDITGCFRLHNHSKAYKQYDVYAKESVSIYKRIYSNTNLPINLRKKALSCIHSMCLDNFGKVRLETFRENVGELALIAGFKVMHPEMLIKYLLSFLGGENVEVLKTIKNKMYRKSLDHHSSQK
jgi:glycosyltransferase involved in cell wall biosynthesis